MTTADWGNKFGNHFLITLTNKERRYLGLSELSPSWDSLAFCSKTNLWYTRATAFFDGSTIVKREDFDMKKILAIISLLLSCSLLLCGCFPKIMIIPDNDSIGEPKVFEKDGIKLTLTENFIEKESELGFYAYYVSNFCGVVVLREDFSLEEGLADCSLEEYIGSVIANNGHADIKPQNQDNLWFYVRDNNGTRSYSYSYKGSNAFWIVQFLCMTSDAPMLEDLFFLWANSVEVE